MWFQKPLPELLPHEISPFFAPLGFINLWWTDIIMGYGQIPERVKFFFPVIQLSSEDFDLFFESNTFNYAIKSGDGHTKEKGYRQDMIQGHI